MKAKKVEVFDFGLVCLKFKAKCVCESLEWEKEESVCGSWGGERKGKEYDCDDDMCIVSVDENDRVACIGP